MAKGARRDKSKEAFWKQKLQEHGQSGVSIRAFCRRHRLVETAFYFWRRELARRQTEHRPVARPGQLNARPGQLNARPGQLNARPGQLNARPGQLNARPGQLKRTEPLFVPVHVTAQEPPVEQSGPATRGGRRNAGRQEPCARIEIELSGDCRIHLTPPVDKQALADVLAVLTDTRNAPADARAVLAEARPC